MKIMADTLLSARFNNLREMDIQNAAGQSKNHKKIHHISPKGTMFAAYSSS